MAIKVYLWHVQAVLSLIVCLTYFIGVQHFFGGICEYWSCAGWIGMLLEIELVILLLASVVSLASALQNYIFP